MGVCNPPESFQYKMNEMFRGIEFIRAYIDKLLIIPNGDCSDHLNKLELLLKNIRVNRLKRIIERSLFGKTDMGYMGFWVMRTGIQRVNERLEAIVNTKSPKTETGELIHRLSRLL